MIKVNKRGLTSAETVALAELLLSELPQELWTGAGGTLAGADDRVTFSPPAIAARKGNRKLKPLPAQSADIGDEVSHRVARHILNLHVEAAITLYEYASSKKTTGAALPECLNEHS